MQHSYELTGALHIEDAEASSTVLRKQYSIMTSRFACTSVLPGLRCVVVPLASSCSSIFAYNSTTFHLYYRRCAKITTVN
jgi:hypothetical protein